MRGVIQTLKNNMRFAKNPFDGSGYAFKQAVRELRSEGLEIVYDKENCRYINPKTLDLKWK